MAQSIASPEVACRNKKRVRKGKITPAQSVVPFVRGQEKLPKKEGENHYNTGQSPFERCVVTRWNWILRRRRELRLREGP